jgi:hypothetical protein
MWNFSPSLQDLTAWFGVRRSCISCSDSTSSPSSWLQISRGERTPSCVQTVDQHFGGRKRRFVVLPPFHISRAISQLSELHLGLTKLMYPNGTRSSAPE